jgi:hypothetical protein
VPYSHWLRMPSIAPGPRPRRCPPLTSNHDELSAHSMSAVLNDDVWRQIFELDLRVYEAASSWKWSGAHPMLVPMQVCRHWKVRVSSLAVNAGRPDTKLLAVSI